MAQCEASHSEPHQRALHWHLPPAKAGSWQGRSNHWATKWLNTIAGYGTLLASGKSRSTLNTGRMGRKQHVMDLWFTTEKPKKPNWHHGVCFPSKLLVPFTWMSCSFPPPSLSIHMYRFWCHHHTCLLICPKPVWFDTVLSEKDLETFVVPFKPVVSQELPCTARRTKHSWNGILQAGEGWAWAWSDTVNHFYVLNRVKYLVSACQLVQALKALQWERMCRRDPLHVHFPAVRWVHLSHKGAHLPKDAVNTEVFKGAWAASGCLRNLSPLQSLLANGTRAEGVVLAWLHISKHWQAFTTTLNESFTNKKQVKLEQSVD